MNKRIQILLLGVLIIILPIGVMIFGSISTSGFEKTTAKVTAVEYDPTYIPSDDDNSDKYSVTLAYSVNGTAYTTDIQANMNDYNVGQEVQIKYDPANPNSISIGEMSLPIMIAVGAVAFIIGAIIIIKGLRM